MTSGTRKERRRVGRPPAGAREGERVKDYPQLSVRVPPEIKRTLFALSIVGKTPQSHVVADAIECYLGAKSASEQRLVKAVVERLEGRARH